MVTGADAGAMQRTVADLREVARRDDLLQWANYTLAGDTVKEKAKGKELRADNFDVAWRNSHVVSGLVQAGLMQALNHSAGLDFALSSELPEKSIEKVLAAAEIGLGVERTMSATQMASGPVVSAAQPASANATVKRKSYPVSSLPTAQKVHEGKIAMYAEGLREAERERQLLGWLNGRIKEFGCVAKDFAASFRDPKLVCALVKSFAPTEVELARPNTTLEAKKKELAAAMEVGERKCQVPRPTTASAMLASRNTRFTKQYVEAFRDLERKQQLLGWLNAKIAGAGLKQVENFDDDMRDGKVAVALVNAFLKGRVPDKVTEQSKQGCVGKAFAAAQAELQIRALMSPRTLTEEPDAVLVQKYIQSFMDQDRKVGYSDPQTDFGVGLGQVGEGARTAPKVASTIEWGGPEELYLNLTDEERAELKAKATADEKVAAAERAKADAALNHFKSLSRPDLKAAMRAAKLELAAAQKVKDFSKCAELHEKIRQQELAWAAGSSPMSREELDALAAQLEAAIKPEKDDAKRGELERQLKQAREWQQESPTLPEVVARIADKEKELEKAMAAKDFEACAVIHQDLKELGDIKAALEAAAAAKDLAEGRTNPYKALSRRQLKEAMQGSKLELAAAQKAGNFGKCVELQEKIRQQEIAFAEGSSPLSREELDAAVAKVEAEILAEKDDAKRKKLEGQLEELKEFQKELMTLPEVEAKIAEKKLELEKAMAANDFAACEAIKQELEELAGIKAMHDDEDARKAAAERLSNPYYDLSRPELKNAMHATKLELALAQNAKDYRKCAELEEKIRQQKIAWAEGSSPLTRKELDAAVVKLEADIKAEKDGPKREKLQRELDQLKEFQKELMTLPELDAALTQLEKDIKAEKDPAKRDEMQRELGLLKELRSEKVAQLTLPEVDARIAGKKQALDKAMAAKDFKACAGLKEELEELAGIKAAHEEEAARKAAAERQLNPFYGHSRRELKDAMRDAKLELAAAQKAGDFVKCAELKEKIRKQEIAWADGASPSTREELDAAVKHLELDIKAEKGGPKREKLQLELEQLKEFQKEKMTLPELDAAVAQLEAHIKAEKNDAKRDELQRELGILKGLRSEKLTQLALPEVDARIAAKKQVLEKAMVAKDFEACAAINEELEELASIKAKLEESNPYKNITRTELKDAMRDAKVELAAAMKAKDLGKCAELKEKIRQQQIALDQGSSPLSRAELDAAVTKLEADILSEKDDAKREKLHRELDQLKEFQKELMTLPEVDAAVAQLQAGMKAEKDAAKRDELQRQLPDMKELQKEKVAQLTLREIDARIADKKQALERAVAAKDFETCEAINVELGELAGIKAALEAAALSKAALRGINGGEDSAKEREGALLGWLNNQIVAYDVQAEKFTDPKALCSLVKSFQPRAVDLSTFTPDNSEAALRDAMAVAQVKLGVTPVEDLSAILADSGDDDAILFVEDVREQARKKELLNWLNSKLRPFGVVAASFDDAFSEPKVLCGLVKAFAPQRNNFDSVTFEDAVRELGIALEVAETKLGIGSMELLAGADADAVADYVSDFREFERREGLLSWLDGRIAPYGLKAADFETAFQDPRVFGALVRFFVCLTVCFPYFTMLAKHG
jgi:hypothetical protein